MDVRQLGLGRRGLAQTVQRPITHREQPRDALADQPDAQRVEQARQPAALGSFEGGREVLRRFFGEALQLGELLGRQAVEVGEVLHQAAVDELLDGRVAEALDVHRAARAEVLQTLFELGGAGGVHAAPVGLALRPEGHAAARGTLGRERVLHGVRGTPGGHDLHDIGNHVAGALDEHGVAHADVLAPDLVLVVQAHVADDDAGQRHGGELGHGRQGAGLADIDLDGLHDGGGLARGELVGDGPARMVRGGAQAPLGVEGIHLHHHTVGLVAERVALGLEPRAVRDEVVECLAARRFWIGLEPGLAQRGERVPVAGDVEPRRRAEVIEKGVERPPRRDRGILLTYGPGRGVAGVGEGRLARFFECAVHLLELGARHERLAAHLDLRQRGQGALQPHRQAADRPQIGRDVLAHAAVAAGGAAHEAPALVEQRDAEAVDLRLAHVREARARQRAVKPRLELPQVVGRRGVVEREHGRAVRHRAEGIHGLAGHALRGAVGGDEVGEGSLHLAQLPHERVVLRVGDLGTRLGVIEVVVVVDLLPQLADALESVSPRHGASA